MKALEFLDCELNLTSDGKACLSVAGSEYTGNPNLDRALMGRLRAAALHSVRYGAILFEALFPSGSDLLAGYGEGLAIAKSQGKRLRFRLRISTAALPELHNLHWELLYDPQRKIALGRSQATSFSRYLPVRRGPRAVTVERPRMLVVLACPRDSEDFGLAALDRSTMEDSLSDSLAPLADHVIVELLEPPITPLRLRKRLVSARYHILHVQAHGLLRSDSKTANLALEDGDGCTSFVDETVFAEICEGGEGLRLVTLMACHSGLLSSTDPFSGLAPALVERGIPAVIAMRRPVSIDLAGRFTEHLYLNLASHGVIDAAVNEARQQLQLEAPLSIDWAAPSLYMRLPEGKLWTSTEADVATENAPAIVPPMTSDPAGVGPRKWKMGAAAFVLALGLLLSLAILRERRPVDLVLQLLWIDDDIYAPLRAEARNGSLTLSFTATEPSEKLDAPVELGIGPGQTTAPVSLPLGLYRLGTDRPDVEIAPDVLRIQRAPRKPVSISIRFLGSTVIFDKAPDFEQPIVIAGKLARAEIPSGAPGAVVLPGIPAGRYRIFSPTSQRFHAFSRDIVVARQPDTYTVELFPQRIRERPLQPTPRPQPARPPSPPPPPLNESAPRPSEANFQMLLRMVRLACEDPKTAGDLSHVFPVLQGSIDGDGRMPVLDSHRQDLRELVGWLRRKGCEGESLWREERERRESESLANL